MSTATGEIGTFRTLADRPVLWSFLCLALLLLAFGLFLSRPSVPRPVARLARPALAKPPTPGPAVQPTVLADLTPDEARASNATFPFAPGKPQPARPFIYTGSPVDRSAALACLAAAVYYEAGDDEEGEQAVAQVVLNRLRHPAFPKTVCGVIFQGSGGPSADGQTGCQFTFSCDGAMRRVPDAKAWERARAIALSALTGFVYKAVGSATHYHADYVVPSWRDSLAKLAVVHTHIFYRWAGAWGLPGAFTGRLQPLEPLDPRLKAPGGPERLPVIDMADDHVTRASDTIPLPEPRASLDIPGVSRATLRGSVVRLMDADASLYALQLNPHEFEGSYAVTAFAICKDRPDCLVMGWLSEDKMPTRMPVLPVGMRAMSFLYRKSSVTGAAKPYWNCQQIARADRSQCLPGTGD